MKRNSNIFLKIKDLLTQNKNIKSVFNLTILSLFIFMSPTAFADDVSNRAAMVSSVYYLVTLIALILGVIMMISSVMKLKRLGDNKNDPKSFPSSIIITMFAGAMAFNYSGSAGTIITSFLGDSDAGYCFVLEDELDKNLDIYDESSCWDSSNSEILGELTEKVNDMSSGAGDELRENAEVIIALFQLIGLIYFLKGLYGLKQVSEGNGRDGYGKPIITLISSALIIDLPHTLEMLKETINLLGFGV